MLLLESVFSFKIPSIGFGLLVEGVFGGDNTDEGSTEQTLLFSSFTSQLIENIKREELFFRLIINSVISGSDEFIKRLILVFDRGRDTGQGFCLAPVSIESIKRLTDNWFAPRLSPHLVIERRHVCRSRPRLISLHLMAGTGGGLRSVGSGVTSDDEWVLTGESGVSGGLVGELWSTI